MRFSEGWGLRNAQSRVKEVLVLRWWAEFEVWAVSVKVKVQMQMQKQSLKVSQRHPPRQARFVRVL